MYGIYYMQGSIRPRLIFASFALIVSGREFNNVRILANVSYYLSLNTTVPGRIQNKVKLFAS